MKNLLSKGLSGNQLKILAVIFMTIDHIGMILFPAQKIFRLIGRLAFPIFAYTFAEGCTFTKNRKRHFLVLLAVGILCQIGYSLARRDLYQNILITLSMSAAIIYSFDYAKEKKTLFSYIPFTAVLLGVFLTCHIMPMILYSLNFKIDYGLFGVMLPALVYLGKNKEEKLFLLSAGLLILATDYSVRQLFQPI